MVLTSTPSADTILRPQTEGRSRAVSLSTSTSKEAREVELAWMHSVCWILTVAAKEVAARAAMVAKVKPFILMVLWCWGVVVWCSVKEGNGSEGGKNRLDLEATANVGVSVLVVVVVGVVVVIEVVVSGVMVVFQLRVSIPYKLSPTSTQHSSPPEIAAAAACGEDPLLHSCALPFAHPRIGSRATLKQRRLARERGRRTLVHR